MRIRLDLMHHCIETEVRRRHDAAISRYFKGGQAKAEVEAELVLLEKALTTFDFAGLRSRWPMVAGGDGRPVLLTWYDNRRPCLRFDDRCIIPPANENTM